MRFAVHGGDFTFLGWESDLEEMAEQLREHYRLKVRGIMGGEPGDVEEIAILNRKLTRTERQRDEVRGGREARRAHCARSGAGCPAQGFRNGPV